MRLRSNDSCHYINCDYAQRREFHRPFWNELRAQLRRWTSGNVAARKPVAASG